MAREITLQELQEWIVKNRHRTWSHEKENITESTLEIKYLRFSLDTRDMKIFRIELDGGTEDKDSVDFRDDGKDHTLLDLLEKKLRPIPDRA